MPDDAPTTDAPTTEPPADDGSGKTFTQDQVNDLIAREKGTFQRKYADYDDLKTKAAEFDKLADSQKSDLERLTGERDTFKTQAETASVENLRLRVALEKSLPAELIDRLQGGTKEEMEADADQLLKLVRPATPGFDGGARGGGTPDDMNARLRAAVGR